MHRNGYIFLLDSNLLLLLKLVFPVQRAASISLHDANDSSLAVQNEAEVIFVAL
jgi:hypothetical protein